jgi:hypothetical protein
MIGFLRHVAIRDPLSAFRAGSGQRRAIAPSDTTF